MMDKQHIAPEDLALHALHADTPGDAAMIAQHLSSCASCMREVAEMRGDLAMIAYSVDQHPLPAGADVRFMRKLTELAFITPVAAPAAQPVIPFAAPAPIRGKRLWPVLVPWAVAASLTAVCVSLGVENKKLSDTINTESALFMSVSAKAAHAQQIADVLNAPAAQRVTLTLAKHPADPSGHAIYLPDRGALLFEANNLKPLDSGKTYELWVIPANGKAPMPAGVFKPSSAGYASVVLPQLPAGIAAKAFGVTIENEGGSATPTMPIILAGG